MEAAGARGKGSGEAFGHAPELSPTGRIIARGREPRRHVAVALGEGDATLGGDHHRAQELGARGVCVPSLLESLPRAGDKTLEAVAEDLGEVGGDVAEGGGELVPVLGRRRVVAEALAPQRRVPRVEVAGPPVLDDVLGQGALDEVRPDAEVVAHLHDRLGTEAELGQDDPRARGRGGRAGGKVSLAEVEGHALQHGPQSLRALDDRGVRFVGLVDLGDDARPVQADRVGPLAHLIPQPSHAVGHAWPRLLMIGPHGSRGECHHMHALGPAPCRYGHRMVETCRSSRSAAYGGALECPMRAGCR